MKKLINESLNEYRTTPPIFFRVGELVEYLNTLDPFMPVGKIGHFGEIKTMRQYDFKVKEGYPIPENGTWRQGKPNEKISILHINSPDIGPDPD